MLPFGRIATLLATAAARHVALRSRDAAEPDIAKTAFQFQKH